MGGEECCWNVGIRRDHTSNEDVLLIYHVCRTSFEGEEAGNVAVYGEE